MWIKLNNDQKHNIDAISVTLLRHWWGQKYIFSAHPASNDTSEISTLSKSLYCSFNLILFTEHSHNQCGFARVFETHTRALKRCADCFQSVGTGRLSWRIHLQAHCREETPVMMQLCIKKKINKSRHFNTPTHLLFSTTKWTANIVM